jgi:hypothetical protein
MLNCSQNNLLIESMFTFHEETFKPYLCNQKLAYAIYIWEPIIVDYVQVFWWFNKQTKWHDYKIYGAQFVWHVLSVYFKLCDITNLLVI